MPNPEHLSILKHSVEMWNQWREKNPEIRPDLVQADLHGMTLGRIDPSSGRLTVTANLCGATLSGADLRGANLRATDLRGANLNKANLEEVNLQVVSLDGADLS